ncbi:unnamed protein product [Rangifer tarandus platyrhynchus]|uniref:Uncharacterized protein n=1 Tax=Rangifer tarandus platyrhynchus TaxID=3082113 RepID=A0ABN8YK44_RANTA|nr:unnamed protein product [Rangifer tarandus platyrhynchus]
MLAPIPSATKVQLKALCPRVSCTPGKKIHLARPESRAWLPGHGWLSTKDFLEKVQDFERGETSCQQLLKCRGRGAGRARRYFHPRRRLRSHFAGSLPGARTGSSGAVRRGDDGGGRREGGGPEPGTEEEHAAVPSPSSARSGGRPRACRLADRTGLRSEQEETPGPSRGGGPAARAPRNGGFAVEDRAGAGASRGPEIAGCARPGLMDARCGQ